MARLMNTLAPLRQETQLSGMHPLLTSRQEVWAKLKERHPEMQLTPRGKERDLEARAVLNKVSSVWGSDIDNFG
jgi:hypothetical protein